jgi:tetratricopeptide (TPR) repeat protein
MTSNSGKDSRNLLQRLLMIGGLTGLLVDGLAVVGWIVGDISLVFPVVISSILVFGSIFIVARTNNLYPDNNWPTLIRELLPTTIAIFVVSVFTYRILSPLFKYRIDLISLLAVILIVLCVLLGSNLFVDVQSFREYLFRFILVGLVLGFGYGFITIVLPNYYSSQIREIIAEGRLEYARQAASRGASLNPLFIEDVVLVGKAYEAIGDYDSAINVYYESQEIAPKSIYPYLALAKAKLANGETVAAINIIETAEAMEVSVPPFFFGQFRREASMNLYLVKGIAHFQNGELYASKEYLSHAIYFEATNYGMWDFFTKIRFAEPYYYRALVNEQLGEPNYCDWNAVAEFEVYEYEPTWRIEAVNRLQTMDSPANGCSY